jgi:predicted adenylyl cyclase CyaB
VARNIEIKARVPSVELMRAKVAAVADRGPTEIVQDDIFFNCPNGRLKLRTFSASDGQLIFYQRADVAGPKESFYVISPAAAPERLRETLSRAFGERGRVRKRRTLYLAGRTRIHLDRVEGLGEFVELEVVLEDDETGATGVAIAQSLLDRLGIGSQQLIEGAYVDLMAIPAAQPSA